MPESEPLRLRTILRNTSLFSKPISFAAAAAVGTAASIGLIVDHRSRRNDAFDQKSNAEKMLKDDFNRYGITDNTLISQVAPENLLNIVVDVKNIDDAVNRIDAIDDGDMSFEGAETTLFWLSLSSTVLLITAACATYESAQSKLER